MTSEEREIIEYVAKTLVPLFKDTIGVQIPRDLILKARDIMEKNK